jgi:acyl-CoA reductase-like NAD-dependent aldehyde dehydrogenase
MCRPRRRVLVNITPAFRADHMPYSGVKDSGQGREGVKYEGRPG